SGDIYATDETRMLHIKELKPEMGTFDCGSMNWLHTSLFINSPKFLEELGMVMQEAGVKPEIEAFDPGMIANAAYYVKKGILKTPCHFQFCMGCANGIVGNVKNLVFMKETMEALVPGSTWSTFGVGHSAMEIMYAAVALGGHIRVGMEDNVMYAKGQLAKSNKQFVERAARVIREFGNEVATPDEAREILGLK
ncbi:MAG: 3-keto-5-aminohexanoate cleavage protein, partial [Firmicutes bacterium]|nr:3-keto-5-aminohexanoate cleavage protein [Bacillota bacterium]